MARPIKQRTTKSYIRDIEALNRLRAAIILDATLDRALAVKACRNIDVAILSIRALLPAIVPGSSDSGEHRIA